MCKIGAGGVLTGSSNDSRAWFHVYNHEDGEAVLTAASAPESGWALRVSAHLCDR